MRRMFDGLVAFLLFSVAPAATAFAAASNNGVVITDPSVPSLITTYKVGTDISWSTCGLVYNTKGCFSAGSITGLSRPCAILAGVTEQVSTATSQYIYILESGVQPGEAATLKVYSKVELVNETVSPPGTPPPASPETTTIKLLKSIRVPLTGGPDASCFMAANDGFVFLGTNQNDHVVRVAKENLAVSAFRQLEPDLAVSQITADGLGYIVVSFRKGRKIASYTFDSNGKRFESASGTLFVTNDSNAVRLP